MSLSVVDVRSGIEYSSRKFDPATSAARTREPETFGMRSPVCRVAVG
jgi:hypothetical protein